MKRAWICVLAATAISGCLNWRGPHHPATGEETMAMHAATEAWIAAGRPDPLQLSECEAMQRTEVVIVSDRSPCVTFTRNDAGDLIRGPNGAACMLYVNPYVSAPSHLAIYLDVSLDHRGRLNGIAHETLHHFRSCVGLSMIRHGEEVQWPGDGVDSGHEDAELWGDILNNALEAIH